MVKRVRGCFHALLRKRRLRCCSGPLGASPAPGSPRPRAHLVGAPWRGHGRCKLRIADEGGPNRSELIDRMLWGAYSPLGESRVRSPEPALESSGACRLGSARQKGEGTLHPSCACNFRRLAGNVLFGGHSEPRCGNVPLTPTPNTTCGIRLGEYALRNEGTSELYK